jgi:hypothetical protein
MISANCKDILILSIYFYAGLTDGIINYFWDVLYSMNMVSIQPIMTVLRMPLLQCLFNPAPSLRHSAESGVFSTIPPLFEEKQFQVPTSGRYWRPGDCTDHSNNHMLVSFLDHERASTIALNIKSEPSFV